MAWSTSYVVPSTLVSALEANGTRFNLDLSSVSVNDYLALFDNTVTPNVDTGPAELRHVAPWNSGDA